MPAPAYLPPLLHNGEPEDPIWWTGVRGQTVQIPANLTRGLSIIINPLVRMPWQFSSGPAPTWAVDPMLLNGQIQGPGAPQRPKLWRESRFDFWARWIRDTILHGIGVVSFEPDSEELPAVGSMLRHNPRDLRPPADREVDDPDQPWQLVWQGQSWPVDHDGVLKGAAGGRRVHFMRGHQGGIIGMHAAELAAAAGVTSYAAGVFEGNVPSGVLTTDQPINQTQSDQTREEWERTQYRRRIAVLGNGAKYQQVVMSPANAAVDQMMALSNTQVAHMLELPAAMLDGTTGDSMTYSNINDRRQDFVDGPLAAWSARIEESLSALLPWGQTMTIDFTEYRKPTMTVATGAAQNIAQEVTDAPAPA